MGVLRWINNYYTINATSEPPRRVAPMRFCALFFRALLGTGHVGRCAEVLADNRQREILLADLGFCDIDDFVIHHHEAQLIIFRLQVVVRGADYAPVRMVVFRFYNAVLVHHYMGRVEVVAVAVRPLQIRRRGVVSVEVVAAGVVARLEEVEEIEPARDFVAVLHGDVGGGRGPVFAFLVNLHRETELLGVRAVAGGHGVVGGGEDFDRGSGNFRDVADVHEAVLDHAESVHGVGERCSSDGRVAIPAVAARDAVAVRVHLGVVRGGDVRGGGTGVGAGVAGAGGEGEGHDEGGNDGTEGH